MPKKYTVSANNVCCNKFFINFRLENLYLTDIIKYLKKYVILVWLNAFRKTGNYFFSFINLQLSSSNQYHANNWQIFIR